VGSSSSASATDVPAPAARDVASIAKVNPTDLTDPHARGASAQE
jgi:hypothetical protein